MKGDKFKQLTIFRDNGKIDIYVLEEFEKDVGFLLPKTYKDLMLKYNGLRFHEDTFKLLDENGDEWDTDFDFYEFTYEKGGIYKFQQGVSDPLYDGIAGLVAIAGAGGGDTICFDYRENPKGDNPKVVLMLHDEFIENEDGSETSVVCDVANSFDEFLDILYSDNNNVS